MDCSAKQLPRLYCACLLFLPFVHFATAHHSYIRSALQIKSEVLQLRICHQHARALCGRPAKILVCTQPKSLQFTTRIHVSAPAISYCDLFPGFQFQKHEVLDTVDDLLSKNPAGLTEDAIELVKVRVLESAQGFFETAFTSSK